MVNMGKKSEWTPFRSILAALSHYLQSILCAINLGKFYEPFHLFPRTSSGAHFTVLGFKQVITFIVVSALKKLPF